MNDDAVNGWLKKANNELNRAQNCASSLDVDGACYNSQQSIEKALKAALVFENITPRMCTIWKTCATCCRTDGLSKVRRIIWNEFQYGM